jgi:uncharacterized Zn finger protein
VRREFDFTDGFPPSKPRDVKGGIRARSRRGAFGQNWWARRWIAVLEGFELGGRLQRARAYARRGQVVSILIEKGRVDAVVQGSRPDPYLVTLETRTLKPEEWRRLAATLNREARFAAQLLAGEMPADVEEAFRLAGLSLFPAQRSDLRTECSCPDWSNPCKHIAAVYYLLGEEFDRDPFLIFRLRGLDRDELILLLARAAATAPARPEPRGRPRRAADPVPSDASAFWQGSEVPAELLGDVEAPPVAAALLARLGAFPFWRGRQPLVEAITPVYHAVSARALAVFLGETRR